MRARGQSGASDPLNLCAHFLASALCTCAHTHTARTVVSLVGRLTIVSAVKRQRANCTPSSERASERPRDSRPPTTRAAGQVPVLQTQRKQSALSGRRVIYFSLAAQLALPPPPPRCWLLVADFQPEVGQLASTSLQRVRPAREQLGGRRARAQWSRKRGEEIASALDWSRFGWRSISSRSLARRPAARPLGFILRPTSSGRKSAGERSPCELHSSGRRRLGPNSSSCFSFSSPSPALASRPAECVREMSLV